MAVRAQCGGLSIDGNAERPSHGHGGQSPVLSSFTEREVRGACLGGAVIGGDHVGVMASRGVALVTGVAEGEHGHGEHVLARRGQGLPLLFLALARV